MQVLKKFLNMDETCLFRKKTCLIKNMFQDKEEKCDMTLGQKV